MKASHRFLFLLLKVVIILPYVRMSINIFPLSNPIYLSEVIDVDIVVHMMCCLGDIMKYLKPFLAQVKKRNVKYGLKMWGSYVYRVKGGLVLGKPIIGTFSCLFVGHEEQLKKDGIGKRNVFAFIRSSPMKYKRDIEVRSYFSGIDIGSEFAKAINNDKDYHLMITYREPGSREHTIKMIQFPGKQSMKFMKESNPGITRKQISSIGEDGSNIEIVDWKKYQDVLPKNLLFVMKW